MALRQVVRLQNIANRGIFTSARLSNFLGPEDSPPPMKLATGLEKRETIAFQKGIDDPYNVNIVKRGPSTKDNPTLIPSAFDSRMVGCLCDEDAVYISWMWLGKGEPKRCSCGHWFKLQYKEPV